MAIFSVNGVTPASSAVGANTALASLWNPSSTKEIRVVEVGFYERALPSGPVRGMFHLETARGTAGSTVTPDADNAWNTQDVPQSGVLLDLGPFSVQPTRSGNVVNDFISWHGGEQASTLSGSGTGYVWTPPSGIRVIPGEGFGIWHRDANTLNECEVYFVWEED